MSLARFDALVEDGTLENVAPWMVKRIRERLESGGELDRFERDVIEKAVRKRARKEASATS